ncbi:MAG: nucleoside phosphorylase [Candidatus Odinarchaeota archaeon]
MSKKAIQPHLHLSEVNETCILSGNSDRVPLIAGFLKERKKISENRGLIAYEGRTPLKDIPVTVLTTGMGCPSAAIVIEEAFRAGGKVFIRVGSSGALEPGMKVGEVVIPFAAIRDESTSLNLAPKEFPAIATPEIHSKLCESAEDLQIPYRKGIVWTSDIFYATDSEKFQRWANCGAKCVEMELSYLFIFGSVKKVKTGGIVTIDGNLAEGTMKDEEHSGESDDHFKDGMRKAISCTIKAIEKIHSPPLR